LIFWARQGLTLVLRIFIQNEKSGLRSSLERLFFKMLIFLYFEILYFFDIFELLENACHTTWAVGQTLKEKKKYFWYF